MPPEAPSRNNSSMPVRSVATPLLIPSSHANTPASTSVSLNSPKQEHTTKISHRLLHMFDGAKSANFQATVMIHELGNVPQLAGDFYVSWKFRGSKPRGHEAAAGVKSKPSLPNLKITNSSTDGAEPSPTSSAVSIRSTSTSSSPATTLFPGSQSSKAPSLASRAATPSHGNPPAKSTTLPLSQIHPTESSRSSSSSGAQQDPHHPKNRPEKKLTDPTPLKQSILPSNPDVLASSPISMNQDPASNDMLHPDGARDFAEARSSISTSDESNVSSSNLSVKQKASIAGLSPLGAPAGAPSNSHLSVPLPRNPARSGTGPSVGTILDSVPGKSDLPQSRPKPPSRTPSMNTVDTMASDSSHHSNHESKDPSLRRHRSASGSHLRSKIPSHASSRKGETPINTLKMHTCTWDYEVQHTMRIPLGKAMATQAGGSTTPRRRPPAPVLGAGPLSDSGLSLIVTQMPSKYALSGRGATGADKNSMMSMMSAVHQAGHHPDGKNPSERGHGSAETHKTTFGHVDVDLAAFAGKGKMTRRFLLRGSRTNATIKLTVEMKWIGGEETWAAPPMQEGHHVTGVNDLINPGTEERLKDDMNLVKTPSNSSSGSSLVSGRDRSNPSAPSSLKLGGNMSNVSLTNPGGQASQVGYKTYDHHLKPQDPDQSPERSLGFAAFDKSSILGKHTHRHRTHHSRHFRDPGVIQQFSARELSPDVVIEAVFNPHAASAESPFTYVPKQVTEDQLDDPESVLENMLCDLGVEGLSKTTAVDAGEGQEEGEREGKMGWGSRMRASREKNRRAVSTTVA